MNLAVRMVLLAGVLGAVGGLVKVVSGGGQGTGAAAAAPRWQSSRQCMECHREVWQEWQGSHHQIAYTNPEVHKLSDGFRNKECQACHLPRPIAVTGYGQRSMPRLTRPDEGVDCLTCHLAADGGILGRHDLPDAPCRPRRSPELGSVEMCASCHNQHKTTDQWRASPQAQAGVHCNDCHMPEAGRPGGRHHGFAGAHDLAMLRSAGVFEAEQDAGQLVLSLRNEGAGHNFPTEERHRAVDITVRFHLEGETVTDWQRVYRFRQPYRDEPGEDTQLPAGTTKTVRIAIPAGARRADARLWYRLTPFLTDDDPGSSLLEERAVVLR